MLLSERNQSEKAVYYNYMAFWKGRTGDNGKIQDQKLVRGGEQVEHRGVLGQ